MSSSSSFKIDVWARCARVIALAALLAMTGSIALGQHEGHEMPGMDMSKPKAKQTQQQKKKGQQPGPKKQDAKSEEMPGMEMKETPAPSPVQTPSPAPSPAASPAPSETPAPTSSPEKMEHDMHVTPVTQAPVTDTLKSEPDKSGGGHSMHDMHEMDSMNNGALMVMSGSDMGIRVGSSQSNIMSMGQMSSGTAWQPSSGPMNMYHKVAGDWLLMFHYNLVAGLNHQGGPRGVTKIESVNWFMPMAYHRLGRGTLQLRGMFSAEPFTFPPGGSPLLFQTGETYKGQPLIDKQHPHDLFMELSAQYTLPLGERATWFTYFGYPGEPALGPVAFMHRASASENLSATLAHHLQDSTHITFGVLTTGFTYRWFKLEGSLFNGREPDENRYDFDSHKWNSRAARLWFAPNNNWTMQVSYGFLRSPEAQEPEADVRRATASVQYNRPFARGNLASAFIWGRNHVSEPDSVHNLNSYTFESTLNFIERNYLYTRLELVDKDELLRAEDRALLGIADEHPSFRIGAYTFGGARDIYATDNLSVAIGSDFTFYSKPSILDAVYGQRPVSWKLFFRIRPGRMSMGHSTHDMHNMHDMHGEMQEDARPKP